MRNLYRDYLYVPEQGKIREKVMLTHAVLAVVIIILCLAAMSLSTYALFSESVSSSINTVQTATFELTVSAESGESVTVSSSGIGSYSAELVAGNEYTVTLAPAGTASTGFCVITASGCDKSYHTCQLGVDTSAPGGRRNSYTFTLKVTADTTVSFLAHWGTSSYYGYSSGSEYYISGDDRIVELTIG